MFGQSASNQSQGGVQIEAMNLMGYDAMALGAQDLAAEASVLSDRLQEATFPILSTNLGPAGVLPLQPYVLRQVEGHTIAIIGATSARARNAAETLGVALEVEHPVDAVARTVGEVFDQADIIIILSNLGAQTNQTIAESVPGIDVIVGNHDGTRMQPQLVGGPDGPVVLHAAGTRGQQLGVLTVKFDAQGRVVSHDGRLVVLDDQFANDPDIVQLLREYGVGP
jgi:2',3'-cyclic-nucleotide 2'-phosphodiesterase (5'-nucleotidase family)